MFSKLSIDKILQVVANRLLLAFNPLVTYASLSFQHVIHCYDIYVIHEGKVICYYIASVTGWLVRNGDFLKVVIGKCGILYIVS